MRAALSQFYSGALTGAIVIPLCLLALEGLLRAMGAGS
jgi:hypothetical protein